MQNRALLYGFSPGSCTGTNPSHLTQPDEDIANFLLVRVPRVAPRPAAVLCLTAPSGSPRHPCPPQVRGPYAYLGSGWSGCRIQSFDYPAGLGLDYGEPTGLCAETAAGSGVFTRDWTKATIQMDCNTYMPTITFK